MDLHRNKNNNKEKHLRLANCFVNLRAQYSFVNSCSVMIQLLGIFVFQNLLFHLCQGYVFFTGPPFLRVFLLGLTCMSFFMLFFISVS